ncbi:hypothetical protein [Streptomyces sp. NPDC057336]|uniref:hypothetical protein n=1 Tax=Streptomyces sp. NPDC057336 TaxID=3346102 RepID=UPI00363D626F
MTDRLAFLILVAALTAWMCGHQAQPFPLGRACGWLYARVRPSRTIPAPRVHRTRQRPPRTPLWARSQPLAYEETL